MIHEHLILDQVSKAYYQGNVLTPILENISYRFDYHTFYSIIGESGAGKSTLLNLIGGLDTPSSGNIHIVTQNSLSKTKKKQASLLSFSPTQYRGRIGFIFQNFLLLDELNIIENTSLPLFVQKRLSLSKKEIRILAEGLLDSLGISSALWQQYPSTLSGGEKQRVAIARAMITKPSIILADEPTGSLDLKNEALVLDALQEMQKKYPCTLILVTHNLKIAKRASKILYLDYGHLKEVSPVGLEKHFIHSTERT